MTNSLEEILDDLVSMLEYDAMGGFFGPGQEAEGRARATRHLVAIRTLRQRYAELLNAE